MGDFNINHLRLDENRLFEEFYNNMIACSFRPKITLPTGPGASSYGGTLIDQIYVKHSRNSNTHRSHSGILEIDVSDHLSIFTFVYDLEPNSNKNRFLKIKSRWQDNLVNIQTDIDSINWDDLISDDNLDINQKFESFMQTVQNIVENYVSEKIVRYNKQKHEKSD